MYTEEVNKTALSSDDDKRLHTFELQHIHTEQQMNCKKNLKQKKY